MGIFFKESMSEVSQGTPQSFGARAVKTQAAGFLVQWGRAMTGWPGKMHFQMVPGDAEAADPLPKTPEKLSWDK